MSSTIHLNDWGSVDFYQNPYPAYERLRRVTQPVHVPALDAPVVFDYALSRSLIEEFATSVSLLDDMSICRSIAGFEKDLVNRLDRVEQGRTFDFMSEIAVPLIVCDASGVNRDSIMSPDSFSRKAVVGNFFKQFLGAAYVVLLQHPKQQAVLRANPQRMMQAVDEIMRYDSPIVMLPLQTTKPVVIGTMIFPQGRKIYICVPAANRDPRTYANADVLDLMRHRPPPHLTFLATGGNTALLREVCERLLTIIVQSLPSLRLVDKPHYEHSMLYRHVSTLHLRRI